MRLTKICLRNKIIRGRINIEKELRLGLENHSKIFFKIVQQRIKKSKKGDIKTCFNYKMINEIYKILG